MSCLILGGRGFIGSHTVETLTADGWSVFTVHRGPGAGDSKFQVQEDVQRLVKDKIKLILPSQAR